MMWAFPRGGSRYERFLTFRDVPSDQVARWKSALLRFMKKLTLRYGKPLLLKSPPHTGRIRLLLELFPDARFVHIHRDPFEVFQSTRHLNRVLTRSLQFQKADPRDLDEAVLRRYQSMHDAYFDERALIPEGHLHEVGFRDLEHDPIGQMDAIYEKLGLAGFEEVRPRLLEQVPAIIDFRKNVYAQLTDDWKARVQSSWRRSFEEWGYPVA
jgi:hypothetical protein